MNILMTSIMDMKKSRHNRPHQLVKHISKKHDITVLSINDWWKGGHEATCIPGVLTQRKAQLHKSLNSEDIIRPGTRMTRIKRIYTDLCLPTLHDNTGRPETVEVGSNVLAGEMSLWLIGLGKDRTEIS